MLGYSREVQDSKFFCLTSPCLLPFLSTQAVDLNPHLYDPKVRITWMHMESPQLYSAKPPISNLLPFPMCLIRAALMAVTKLHQDSPHQIAIDLGRHNPIQVSHIFSIEAMQECPMSVSI